MLEIIARNDITLKEKEDIKNLIGEKILPEGEVYFLLYNRKNNEFFLKGLAILQNEFLEYIFIEKKLRYSLEGTKLIKDIFLYCSQKNINSLKINPQELEKNESSFIFFSRLGFVKEEGIWVKKGILTRKIRFKKTVINLTISVIVNTFLGVSKVVIGSFSGSKGAIADGIQTLIDSITSLMLFFTSYISYQEADENHPFGHSNIENIAAIIIGTFLFITGIELGYDAFLSLMNPRPINYFYLTVIVISLSTLMKTLLFFYKMKSAIELKDASLKADALEAKVDIFSSFGVLIGIILSYYGYPLADPLMSFLISLIILKESYHILREGVDKLMNLQEENQRKEIEKIVYTFPLVKNVHDIRVKYDGNKLFVFMNVRLPNYLNLQETHEEINKIEEIIKDQIENVSEVFIHPEPTMT